MHADLPISRALDQHLFDALSAAVVRKSSGVALMWLDRKLRIRGLNATFEMLSMRKRDELLGEVVTDVFPDDPTDPQASGSSQLVESVDSAMRRHNTDTMPIVRYDITDPHNPEVFLPRLWRCSNTAVDDGPEQIGVLHQVAEITSLEEALTALYQASAGGRGLGATEQLHVLSALAARIPADQDRARALALEIEQLHQALATRDIIGQAKGILMERFDIDAAAAFALLAKLSQQSNTRVAIVAEKLVGIDHPNT